MDSDSEQQKYYLDELFAQCQFALDAYTDVQRLSPFLKNKRKEYTDITKDSRDLFRHLHSLFTHVANISKLLFNRGNGEREKSKREFIQKRSESLRKTLSIPDTGHLLDSKELSRAFRNHLEHYDERLDTWISDWIKNTHPESFETLSKLGIGNEQTHLVVNLGLEEMRVFNYSNMRFLFQNESLDLSTLVESIKELSSRLKDLGAECQLKHYSTSHISYPFRD